MTEARLRLLRKVENSPRRFNGIARRPIKALVQDGLVTAKFDMRPCVKGNGMDLVEVIDVTITDAGRAVCRDTEPSLRAKMERAIANGTAEAILAAQPRCARCHKSQVPVNVFDDIYSVCESCPRCRARLCGNIVCECGFDTAR